MHATSYSPNEFPGLCQLSAIPGLCQLSAINIELGIYLGETPYKCNTKKKYQHDFSYSKIIANLEAFRYVIFSSINLFFWRVGKHSIIITYIITLINYLPKISFQKNSDVFQSSVWKCSIASLYKSYILVALSRIHNAQNQLKAYTTSISKAARAPHFSLAKRKEERYSSWCCWNGRSR